MGTPGDNHPQSQEVLQASEYSNLHISSSRIFYKSNQTTNLRPRSKGGKWGAAEAEDVKRANTARLVAS